MPTWALGSINGRTTLGVTCHHRPWAAHTVRFFWAWQACMVLWRHTHSDDIDRCLPSSPLGSTFFRMTSGMACNHRPWETHTVGGIVKVCHHYSRKAYIVGQRQAWQVIIALVQNTRSNVVGCGMPAWPLGSTHGQMTMGVSCHHRPWETQTV